MTDSILRVRELIEKLEKIEKEYGNIPVVVEDNYDRWEVSYKNLYLCDVEAYDEMVDDNDELRDIYNDKHYSMKPVVHIG